MSATAKYMKEAKKALPEGWRWVKLGEVCDPEKGSSRIGPFGSSLRKDELSESGVPIIGIENVLPNRFDPSFRRYLSPVKYAELSDYTVKPGDVLVSTMGTIGRCAVVPNNTETAIIDSHLFRFRLDPSKADPTFICYIVNGFDGLRQQLETKSSGAIMSGLNTSILKECIVPLPPLPEQKRIAAILKEQMAAVDKARAAAQARLEAVKALPAAFLRQVFPQPGQPLPDGWRWVKLGEVCNRIDYGYTASANAGIDLPKFLRITDIQNGHVNWDCVPGCLIDDPQIADYQLNDEDIVFARTGATTGKSYLVVEPPSAIFASYLIRVRGITDLIVSSYLYAYFQSEGYWQDISAGIRGGAQGGFNAKMLTSVLIPLPPLPEQQRIAAILKEQMAAVVKARDAAEAELYTINTLPAALLRRAFNGDL